MAVFQKASLRGLGKSKKDNLIGLACLPAVVQVGPDHHWLWVRPYFKNGVFRYCSIFLGMILERF